MFLFNDKIRVNICENEIYSIKKQLVDVSKLLEENNPTLSDPRSVAELLEEDLKLAIIELGKILKQQYSGTGYYFGQDQVNVSRIPVYLEAIETLHKLLYEKQRNF